MILFFQPLLHKDHHEHSGHNEFQPFRIEMDQRAEDPAQRRTREPVKMVQERDKEHKPPAVNIFRDIRGIVDGKALVAHSEDQIEFLASHTAELVQHGNPVEQMPCIDHQSHGKSLQRVKRSQKHIDSHKLYGSRKDGNAHQHRIPEAESRHIHINPVCDPQEPKSGKDRYRIWECRSKSFF